MKKIFLILIFILSFTFLSAETSEFFQVNSKGFVDRNGDFINDLFIDENGDKINDNPIIRFYETNIFYSEKSLKRSFSKYKKALLKYQKSIKSHDFAKCTNCLKNYNIAIKQLLKSLKIKCVCFEFVDENHDGINDSYIDTNGDGINDLNTNFNKSCFFRHNFPRKKKLRKHRSRKRCGWSCY